MGSNACFVGVESLVLAGIVVLWLDLHATWRLWMDAALFFGVVGGCIGSAGCRRGISPILSVQYVVGDVNRRLQWRKLFARQRRWRRRRKMIFIKSARLRMFLDLRVKAESRSWICSYVHD